MASKRKFIGYGELGVDKLYDENLNLMLVEGGDSTWNILYNLGLMSEECYAVGSVGKDREGTIALNSLKHVGVDISNVKRQDKPTNVISSVSRKNDDGSTDITFSWICPITHKKTFEISQSIPTDIPEKLKNSPSIVVIMHLEEQYRKFFGRLEDKKVALDLGHEWIFEDKSPEYVRQYLSQIDVCQINGNVLSSLAKKLGISNIGELFELISPDLLMVTYGERGAEFFFDKDGQIKRVSKRPAHVLSGREVVDTSGAGDAFFAVVLKGYRKYLDSQRKIDEEFVDNIFPLANTFSSQIIGQKGCRGTSRILGAVISQEQSKSKTKELDYR